MDIKNLTDMQSNLTPNDIDKCVCDWSMDLGVALTEDQLNALVDRILAMLGVMQ